MTALGAFFDSYLLMEISRFVFGIGGESLAVAQNTYASAWFRGKALNAVFGLQLSIARLGSTVNYQASGPIFNATLEWQGDNQNAALGWTLLITGTSTILSVVAAVILGYLDRRKSILTGSYLEEQPKVVLKEVLKFPLSLWLVCFVCVVFYVTIFPFVSYGKNFYMQRFHFTESNANFINGNIFFSAKVQLYFIFINFRSHLFDFRICISIFGVCN